MIPVQKKCEQYDEDGENTVAFRGHKNVLSNFYPVDVNINGEYQKSAEHACRLTVISILLSVSEVGIRNSMLSVSTIQSAQIPHGKLKK